MRASRPSRSPQVGTLVVAVALATVLAGIVVAPALGDAIQPPRLDLWPELQSDGEYSATLRPEPAELVRYALAVLAPVVIAALLLFGPGGAQRTAGRISIGRVGTAGAVVGLALIAGGWANQAEFAVFGVTSSYFDGGDLLVACVLAAVLALAATPTVRGRLAPTLSALSSAGRSRVSRIGMAVLVAVVTALYLAPAVYTDVTLDDAPSLTSSHVPFTLADFAAFGNGATPLADFASQYTNLLPWVLHPALTVLDYSSASFTVVMAALSAVRCSPCGAPWRWRSTTSGRGRPCTSSCWPSPSGPPSWTPASG